MRKKKLVVQKPQKKFFVRRKKPCSKISLLEEPPPLWVSKDAKGLERVLTDPEQNAYSQGRLQSLQLQVVNSPCSRFVEVEAVGVHTKIQ